MEDRSRHPTPPLRRSTEGRWLGGVCHGLAERTGTPVGQVRGLTVLFSLLFGAGVLAYLVCWLILPGDGEGEEAPALVRGLTSAALLLVACAGLGGLALLGGGAALFGFGWTVAIATAVVVVGTLVCWPAIRPGWALVPLVALALPAVAVAATGVRIEPQSGTVVARPTTLAALPKGPYRAGLGDLLVDLRGLPLAAGTTVPIRIDAGTGRTVVALPHDRCVNVEVRYRTGDLDSRLADAFLARLGGVYGPQRVSLFGDEQAHAGSWTRRTTDRRAPTVRIDFHAVRGALWVRDYPSDVAPLETTDWPGLQPPPLSPEDRRPEWRASKRNSPAVKRMWREWRRRMQRFERQTEARRAGPCATARTIG